MISVGLTDSMVNIMILNASSNVPKMALHGTLPAVLIPTLKLASRKPLQLGHSQYNANTILCVCQLKGYIWSICGTAYSEEMTIQINVTIFWEVRARSLLGIYNKPPTERFLLGVSIFGQQNKGIVLALYWECPCYSDINARVFYTGQF